jgi:glycosyltransferase involved in cell wall biosynthesis
MKSLDGGTKAVISFIVLFLPSLFQFIAWVRAYRPDVINIHCISVNGVYGCIAGRILRIPVILTTHSEITMDVQQLYMRKSFASAVLPLVVHLSSAITACSKSTMAAFKDYVDVKDTYTTVIENGIEQQLISHTQRNHKLLFVGRLVKQKGIDVLLRALVGTDRFLQIVGDGPERQALEDLVHSLGVHNQVEFLGAQTPTDVRNIMLQCMCLCVPSTGVEGLPMVVLEALSTRTFVVASSIGGIPEVLTPHCYGVLIEPGNVDHWHNTLMRIEFEMDNQKFKQVKKAYDNVDMANAYSTLYRAVLNGT